MNPSIGLDKPEPKSRGTLKDFGSALGKTLSFVGCIAIAGATLQEASKVPWTEFGAAVTGIAVLIVVWFFAWIFEDKFPGWTWLVRLGSMPVLIYLSIRLVHWAWETPIPIERFTIGARVPPGYTIDKPSGIEVDASQVQPMQKWSSTDDQSPHKPDIVDQVHAESQQYYDSLAKKYGGTTEPPATLKPNFFDQLDAEARHAATTKGEK